MELAQGEAAIPTLPSAMLPSRGKQNPDFGHQPQGLWDVCEDDIFVDLRIVM